MKQFILIATVSTIALAGFSSLSPAQSRHRKGAAYTEAKAKCLEEQPGLSGKKLQKCIKEMKKK